MDTTPQENATMDTNNNTETKHDSQPSHVIVNYNEGNTAVAVAGTDLALTDTEGWQVAGRRHRQRAADAAKGEPASTTTLAAPAVRQAKFVKRITTKISKAARMPRTLPREDIKVVIRPRGGLNVGRTEVSKLMAAIFAATGTTLQESREDTICTNVAQNIIVVSTPQEARADKYARISLLKIGDREYEVHAYLSAPNGTTKGIIRGISLTDSHQEIQDNIIHEANPLALEAHRIGNSTTVIVAFEGTKVPNYVKYGAMLVKCSLYRQHFEVCHCCGKVGHRTDVCPFPGTKVCFACGAPNPSPSHEQECKPHCKLCNGAHPTGVAGCRNRYKIPYVVTRRRWEKKHMAEQQPPLGLAQFPQLQPSGAAAQMASADVRAAATGSAPMADGAAHPDNKITCKSQFGEGAASWADMARSRTNRGAAQHQQRAGAPQASPEVLQLRKENEHLRKQLAEQDRRLQEMNRKLDLLLSNRGQEQGSTPAQRQVTVQTLEQPTETPIEEPLEEETQEETAAAAPEPRAKRRRATGAEAQANETRLQHLEECFTHTEASLTAERESTNIRLAALEASTADIATRLTQVEQMFQTVQNTLLKIQAAMARQIVLPTTDTQTAARHGPSNINA